MYLFKILNLIELDEFIDWFKEKYVKEDYDDIYIDGFCSYENDTDMENLCVNYSLSFCRCCPSVDRDQIVPISELEKFL